MSSFNRITPEEALKIAKEQERGHLKIFLGYAPGVGKTYAMLNEANRRAKRGEDIIIGYLESHQRKETEEQIEILKTIPRKKVTYNGITLEEMDTNEIIKIHPQIVLVDELAHTNAPGSKNKKRYEDVEEILKSGISVITTLNIQHLESLNDVVKQITGVTVRETIPDRIVETADEVVVVDITPDALLNRMRRGNIYKNDTIARAMKNFFRKGNLNALREITLRQTAEEVNEDLAEYMEQHGILNNWHTVERVMVCISSSLSSKKLIRRGARIANRYQCEWYVVYINSTRTFIPQQTQRDKEILESNFKLGNQLGAEIVKLKGKSVSKALADFALKKHITQIILGHSKRTKLQIMLRGSTINKLLKFTQNEEIEIHIIPY